MAFWDLYEHIFRFSELKLCPPYEEFSAIVGQTPTEIEIVVFTNQTVIYP